MNKIGLLRIQATGYSVATGVHLPRLNRKFIKTLLDDILEGTVIHRQNFGWPSTSAIPAKQATRDESPILLVSSQRKR